MRADLRDEGKMPVSMERLTIERIVGDISFAIFLRTVVGIGSRSQDELDDWNSSLMISSKVARVKEEKDGRVRVVSSGQGGRRVGL